MRILLAAMIGLVSTSSWAMKDKQFGAGFGYYSYNAFYRTTSDETGEADILGTAYFPISFRYDYALSDSWHFSPRLLHTFIPDDEPDKTETRFTLLDFAFGKSSGDGGLWDWTLGIAYFRYSIKGPGGTVELQNGTGTSTFARPGRTESSQTWLYSASVSRQLPFGDIVGGLYFTSPFQDRQTFSFLISFHYAIGTAGADGGGTP